MMQSTVEQERRQEYLSRSGGDNLFRAARGGTMGMTDDGANDAGCPKPSVLGGVRRITQKRGACGRDIVEIEHTDGTETTLVFDSIS